MSRRSRSSSSSIARYQEQKVLLVMSELKLVHAQVNPHFLFNALNTIIAILRRDTDRARDLLIHLSLEMRPGWVASPRRP